MYQAKVDPHTHTIFSGHAFSTIGENAAYAAKMGLEALGMADHYGPTFSADPKKGPNWGAMGNMAALPKSIEGVEILASMEIDIVDFAGHVGFWQHKLPFRRPGDPENMTMNDLLLDTRDFAIASVHRFPGMDENTLVKNTEMYCRVLENPKIHIIGHPGRSGLRFDLKEVCAVAKQHGKMLEINDHSFDSNSDVTDECQRIAQCCAETGTYVVVSSDAHSAWFVGHMERALAMLEKIHFPVELIANRTLADFRQVLQHCI